MYQCCACATPFSWWTASFSTLVSPCRCPRCDVEQYRRLPLLRFIGMYSALLAATAVAFVAAVSLVETRDPPAWIFLPALGIVVAWERHLHRRGEMRPASPRGKRIAQVLFWSVFVVTVALVALGLWLPGSPARVGA